MGSYSTPCRRLLWGGVVRFARDRTAMAFLGLLALGVLLLVGVLLALLLTGGEKRTAPPTTHPATSAAQPPTTVAVTTAPPSGPLRPVAVGPFSATVEWTGGSAPERVAYGLPELGPTLWAPIRGNRAELAGLRFATAYRVWAGDSTLDLTTAPAPDSPTASVGTGVLLDGQPFFPVLVLAQCGLSFDAGLEAGITVFVENGCGGIAAQSSALAGRALSLTAAEEAGIGGPGVIGWYYPDEPDLKGVAPASLPQFPSLEATGRLRVLTLSNHFYSRTAPLPAGRDVYPGLVAPSDFVGFDLYPLQEFCDRGWLAEVVAAQRELVALARPRPTFQWIEARTWRCRRAGLRVTPATIRAESWLAVAGGARGLGFFPADWPAALTPAIGGVVNEVTALQPALGAPDEPVSADAPLVVGARSFGGAFYVIAVNPTEQRLHATIRAAGLTGNAATVLDEGRSVEVSGGSLSDGFAPLAVHVYVVAP
jgi:hypothetical protein